MANGDLLHRAVNAGRHKLMLHFDERTFDPEFFGQPVNNDDVDAAVLYLRELLRGFPFESGESEAVAIALLMTAVLRPCLHQAPGFGISARAPGTGKTYLTTIASELATGREPGLISWPNDEIEFRKTLLSCALGGDAILPIDNLNGTLRSDALCVFVTSQRYRQRMLGGNEQAEVPTRTLVVVMASISQSPATWCADSCSVKWMPVSSGLSGVPFRSTLSSRFELSASFTCTRVSP